ncbi:MAG: PHP domain-containing protein, partial [Solirubrobacterales bacterium]
MSVYVELHSHSAFSFLDGASLPEELAARAVELGYEAMALTDHDGIWGSMEFARAARGLDLRPITGVELTLRAPGAPLPDAQLRGNCPPGCFHLTLLVETAAGYRNLCRLLTAAHAHTRRRNDRTLLPAAAELTTLAAHSEGLICLSGCARDGALAGRLARERRREAEALGRHLLGIFGPRHFRVELQRPFWQGDRERNRALAQLAAVFGVPTVATGNVHYHHRSRAPLQDALVATRLLGTLESTEPDRRGNGAA